jgi:tetratricopeptide (TPR) repeat protein
MKTEPEERRQLLDLVWKNIHGKDIRQAIDNSNLLVKKFPDFAPGWHVTSHVAQLIKRPNSALVAIDRAIKLQPSNIDWQLHRISCLLMCGNNTDATESTRLVLTTLTKCTPGQLDQLAFLCSRMDLFDEAAGIYRRLIDQQPANGGHWYNLASIQRFQGENLQAETSLDKAIALNEKDYEAYELRSNLKQQTLDSNHVEQLEALLGKGINLPAGEVRIRYALAKELEDIGESERAFKSLELGASLRRKHINYNLDDDLETIEAIIATFDASMLDVTARGFQTREPIFVIGLPRTGTTLVERILGSHPDVFAAGELNHFATQLMSLVRRQTGPRNISRQQLVSETSRVDFERLGKAYIDSSRPLTGHTRNFVDKLPLNFLYAGLIRIALPQAKIIHIRRHPMDSCYAIYKRLFEDAYPWSYDLGEIAAYYAAYDRLMRHWQTVMPGVIHQLSYEELVLDQEGQTRQLLEHCGLGWEPRCLRFYENAASSTTASASQVRQPIYTSSIGRWKSYRSQLSPLYKELKRLGIAVD